MCPFAHYSSFFSRFYKTCKNIAVNIYSIIILRITMCPPGYHHNSFMATPELRHRMYGDILCKRITLWSHQSAQTVISEQCIVQIVNVPHGDSPPSPRECSNCKGSERSIPRITMCPLPPPPGYHHNGFMTTPELGHRMDGLIILYASAHVCYKKSHICVG